jgi:hypothetical protein
MTPSTVCFLYNALVTLTTSQTQARLDGPYTPHVFLFCPSQSEDLQRTSIHHHERPQTDLRRISVKCECLSPLQRRKYDNVLASLC